MNQQFRNLTYCSDVSGTGFWRHIQQIMSTNCLSQNLGTHNTYTQDVVLDQNYYRGMTSVTVQRWISDQHRDIFQKFLLPVMNNNRGWLIYGIDDAMHYDEIPLYNRGRMAFANDKIQENIKFMLNKSDFVITTTEYIKNYYNRKYGVPLENIIAVPNLLPKWWFGDRYDPERKLSQFNRFKSKPRIGIISSLSHYNIDNIRVSRDGKACKMEKQQDGTEKWFNQDHKEVSYDETDVITDDLDEILDTIKQTVNDVQWVFFGYAPPKLSEYFEKNKIEYHPGVAILNYPSVIENLCLQAVVAPVKDMEFNRCKSHIKYLECCAAGIPLFATNVPPYSTVMDRKFLFDNQDELKEKILRLKQMSNGAYRKMIETNWNWFNTPKKDGDYTIKNGWLEDNLQIWADIFRLRNKYSELSLNAYVSQKKMNEKKRAENTIFSNSNGIEILK